MKIELFQRTIYQEYPDDYRERVSDKTGVDKFLAGWPAEGWPMKYWQYNYSRYENFPSPSHERVRGLKRLKLRKEEEGGFVFDPSTTAIFWADDSAFKIISLLQKNTAIEDISHQENVSKEELLSLITTLKSLGLC